MYAGSSHEVVGAAIKLFAKQCDVATSEYEAAADVKQYQVCVITGGKVGVAPASIAAGTVVCIAASEAKAGQVVPVYTSGEFNHEALVWHSTLTDFTARRNSVVSSQTINVHNLPL